MSKKRKKMDQGKKNFVSRMIAKGISYINNDSIFNRKKLVSKGYTKANLKRKQGVIGK